MKPMTIVTVRAGVPATEQLELHLPAVQKIVGGYVEHVRLRGQWTGLHMWVNEQGHLEELPVRPQPFYPGPVAGDYFITRLTPDGDFATLTPADVEQLLAVLEAR